MTATAAAIKRLDDLFQNIRLENESASKNGRKTEHVHFNPVVVTKKCDIHGRRGHATLSASSSTTSNGRRGSLPGAGLSAAKRRDIGSSCGSLSIASRVGAGGNTLSHPAAFASSLRKDTKSYHGSTNSLKRGDISLSALNGNGSGVGLRLNGGRTTTTTLTRRLSTDSLDSLRRNSWDTNRRESSGSSAGFDDPIWEENNIKEGNHQAGNGQNTDRNKPRFLPVTTLDDTQAIRCAEFHPRGNLYVVGSNTKTLRVCAYPKVHDLRDSHKTCQPTTLFKRTKHHKGSIYCMAWTPIGDLLATGSNDKTVKLMKFNNDTANFEGQEIELAMHDGTVRDVCFLEDTSNKSSLLISGGAGDCKIYVTDCATGQPYQAFTGHRGHIISLYNWGGVLFVSGSQDRTVRFWDLRTRGCVNVLTPVTSPHTKQGSPVGAVCVDPSGRLLVSGHEDSACVLYDIRGSRTLQCFRPHTSDIRSIRFSPSAYYLLTGGYDNKLMLTDLQGELTSTLPSVVVAQHRDKVISGRWHPNEFSFLSTSADKTATLWALPSA